MNENLILTAEKLIKYGKKAGADQMQVSIGNGNEFSVEVRDGNIEKIVEAGSKSISFKVILDNKVAWASSSDFKEETLHKLVNNAIKRAKLTSSDPFAGLPDKVEPHIDVAKLKLFDESILSVSTDKKIEIAKTVERIALSDKRVKKSSGSYFGNNIGEFILMNSNGFSGSYKQSSCSFGVYLQAGEGDNVNEDGWGTSSLSFNGLDPIESTAKKAVHRVTRLIGARKIKSQNAPLILEPQMTASILGFLYQCLSGSAIYMNQSFLVNKLNEKIAADIVNIVDDPHMPAGHGSRPYDGEGVPTAKMDIIRNGELKTYFLDTYSARKLKMQSTGHASGPGNFYIEKGKYSPEEIIKSVDKGLLLTRTIGQGTVATTGDISKGAFGLWIENGEIAYPVSEITISGNLGEMLKNIEMIGSDLEFKQSISGPTVKIKDITISGL